jgi:hypothetical protein
MGLEHYNSVNQVVIYITLAGYNSGFFVDNMEPRTFMEHIAFFTYLIFLNKFAVNP